MHAKPLQRSKKPRTFHGYDGSDFDWFYFNLTQVLEIHTILFKYTCIIRNFAKLAALCLIQDQVHLLWKKKWISIFNILLPLHFLLILKRNYASYTLHELHYSATTSWNIYCSKPMHLLGLGNKFGVRIINTTKTPDKEPTFPFINGN